MQLLLKILSYDKFTFIYFAHQQLIIIIVNYILIKNRRMQQNIQNQDPPSNIRMTKKAQQAKTIILQQLRRQNIQNVIDNKQIHKHNLPQQVESPTQNKLQFSKQNKGKCLHMYKSALYTNKLDNINDNYTSQQNRADPLKFKTQQQCFIGFSKQADKKVQYRLPSFLKKTDKKLIERGQRKSSMIQSDIMTRPSEDKISQEQAIQENKNTINYQFAEIMIPSVDNFERLNRNKKTFTLQQKIQDNYQQMGIDKHKEFNTHKNLINSNNLLIAEDQNIGSIKTTVKQNNQQTNSNNCIQQNINTPQISKTLTLDDFEIGQLLGKGSFGSVHIVRHKQTGFFFALKTYSKKQIGQKLDRYIHCIKLQMFSKHPNIAQLYSVFAEGQKVYWLMQLCMDGDLSTQAKKLKNKKQQTRTIVRSIIKGVQYLHEHQIIHRDIKLENILLSYGLPKITDFDLSIYQPDPSESRRTFCGSPMYFSPQMLSNESYNNKVDVWCLGIICYELNCGYYPFEVGKYNDINNIVNLNPKPFPQNIDAQTKDFIDKMLVKNPEQRAYWRELINHPYLSQKKRK